MLVGEGVRLREEKLVARTFQLETALVLDRAEQFPRVAAVGNELGHGGELAVDGREQRLALREKQRIYVHPVGFGLCVTCHDVVQQRDRAFLDEVLHGLYASP